MKKRTTILALLLALFLVLLGTGCPNFSSPVSPESSDQVPTLKPKIPVNAR